MTSHTLVGRFLLCLTAMSPRTLLLAAGLLALVTTAYVVYAIADKQVRTTGAYALAMDRVATDTTIGVALGRPIERGLWVESDSAEYLTLKIPLRGTINNGHIEVMADVDGTDVEALALVVAGKRTDLLARDAEVMLRNLVRDSWIQGASLIRAGQPAEAVVVLDEAIELEPTMANAWYLRGQARIALEEYDAAEADLIEAARLDPADPETPALLGEMYFSRRQYSECVSAHTSVLSLDAENNAAWYARAVCYERLKDYRKALAGSREACVGGLEVACEMQNRLKRDRYELTSIK